MKLYDKAGNEKDVQLHSDDGWHFLNNAVMIRKVNGIVYLRISFVSSTINSWTKLADIPKEYEPENAYYFTIAENNNTLNNGMILVNENIIKYFVPTTSSYVNFISYPVKDTN